MSKLKIMFINDCEYYKYNSSIHIGFIAWLQNKYSVLEYGRNSELFKFSIKHTSFKEYKNVYNSYSPDVILTYNSNGSTEGKKNKDRMKWAKKLLEYASCLKIHITTDHCQKGYDEEQIEWFSNYPIDIALFRHKSFEKYSVGIESHWFPFSVDRELYIQNNVPFKYKIKKVGFAGTYGNSIYPGRNAAIEFLNTKKLLNIEPKKMIGADYIKSLSSNIANLTCGGKCRYFTAKYIEILAAGSFLLCTDTDGLDIIPNKYYFKYDIEQIENLKNIFYNVLSMPNLEDLLKESQNYALVKHSHKKRYLQLNSIIKNRI